MKLLTSLTITIALAAPLLAQTPNSSVAEAQAKQELIETARAYRERKFAEAQAHSEKALLLDPQNKTAPSFIARSIHAQYKPGDTTPENLAKAREAIIAYQRFFASNVSVANNKRADAYVILASKDRDCSFKITELPNHKVTTVNGNKAKREMHRQYEEALRVTTTFSERFKSKP
ncbi:MAG TPA: hypothetical protein VFT48_07215 [Pyrinomonadaceae bacterium]|nr:hypothetical protein [Pyrinomonadaceae bacterium]